MHENSSSWPSNPLSQSADDSPSQEQETDTSTHALLSFESQVRFVAEQAEALRQQSIQLRRDRAVNQAQLEACMGLLAGLGKKLDIADVSCVVDQPTTMSDERLVSPPMKMVASEKRGSRRRNHRHEQLSVLRSWFDEHCEEPYPSNEEKEELAHVTGMEIRQIEHCAFV